MNIVPRLPEQAHSCDIQVSTARWEHDGEKPKPMGIVVMNTDTNTVGTNANDTNDMTKSSQITLLFWDETTAKTLLLARGVFYPFAVKQVTGGTSEDRVLILYPRSD